VTGLKWPLKIRSTDGFHESHTHIQILLISQFLNNQNTKIRITLDRHDSPALADSRSLAVVGNAVGKERKSSVATFEATEAAASVVFRTVASVKAITSTIFSERE